MIRPVIRLPRVAMLCVFALTMTSVPVPAGATSDLAPLRVEGNRLVDSSGNHVVLRGVNRPGTEYMCAQDRGIADGPIDQASIAAIRSWRVNAVRVPLNEHCWLGIDDGATSPQYIGEAYRESIAGFIDRLVAGGLYVILELKWSAPAGQDARGQGPMPNTSYSAAFWGSVADRFKHDGRVIFDLFNEPVPNNNQNDATDEAARRSWECWRDGGTTSCDPTLSLGTAATTMSASEAIGMQALVNAVRSTGASNVIMLGGIQWANTLWSRPTRSWLAYKPADPLGNLVAAVHVYPGNWCVTLSCYDAEIAPVAAQVPVVASEVGIGSCDGETVGWLIALLSWLDARRSGYLAWAWSPPHSGHDPCTVIKLILSYDGVPSPYGEIYKAHLATLPLETATTLSSSAATSREGEAVTFTATTAAFFGPDPPHGSVVFAVDGRDVGTASLDSTGQASLTLRFADDGHHEVIGRYLGAPGFEPSTSGVRAQLVQNLAPAVGAVEGAADPVAVGAPLAITVAFTDPGTMDTHAAEVDWGDGTISPAVVTETAGSGALTASHSYAAAGLYDLVANVADEDGGSGRSDVRSVVVFDPSAGFVTGAGWFESPPGAHPADAALGGRASFGFVSKYQEGATEPFGQIGLRLGEGRFSFVSHDCEWLVVVGASAQLQCSGQVDGAGAHRIFLSVVDGQREESGGADRLRVKVWDQATGQVVFDTQAGAPDSAEPTVGLGAGSIAIRAQPAR
jgi:hypothetical protein